MFWRVVVLLNQALQGAGFLHWREVGAGEILGQAYGDVAFWRSVADDGGDGIEADEAAGLQSAVAGYEVKAVAVLGHGDWVDQTDRSDAVREFAERVGVQGETVVVLVVGVDQVKGQVAVGHWGVPRV